MVSRADRCFPPPLSENQIKSPIYDNFPGQFNFGRRFRVFGTNLIENTIVGGQVCLETP